jgi:hypothetical protein
VHLGEVLGQAAADLVGVDARGGEQGGHEVDVGGGHVVDHAGPVGRSPTRATTKGTRVASS